MNTKTTLLVIAIVFLAGLVLFFWHTNARVDKELILAEAEAKRIEAALEDATRETKEKELALEQVKAETQSSLEGSARAIRKLEEENAEARERAAAIEADKLELETRIHDLIAGQTDPVPQPLDESIAEGIQLYPDRDLSGAVIQANDQGALLFQVMVEEITGRRVLGIQNDQLQAECSDQVARLQAVIREHEERELAMGKAYKYQDEVIEALKEENLQLKDWGRNLEDQVALYKKRHSWPWLDKAEKLLALYGIYKIGEGVLK